MLLQRGRPQPEHTNGAAELGMSLGDLKLAASHLSLHEVLDALDIRLSTGTDALDENQVRKAVADKIVAEGLPPNLRGLLASLLQIGKSKASVAISLTDAVPLDASPVGPSVAVNAKGEISQAELPRANPSGRPEQTDARIKGDVRFQLMETLPKGGRATTDARVERDERYQKIETRPHGRPEQTDVRFKLMETLPKGRRVTTDARVERDERYQKIETRPHGRPVQTDVRFQLMETLPKGGRVTTDARVQRDERYQKIETTPFGRPVAVGYDDELLLTEPRRTSDINLLKRDVVDALKIRQITVTLPEQPKLDIRKIADRPIAGKALVMRPAANQTLLLTSVQRAYNTTVNLDARAVIGPAKTPTDAIDALNGKAVALPNGLKLLENMEVGDTIVKEGFKGGLLLQEVAPTKQEATIGPDWAIQAVQQREHTAMPPQSKADLAHEAVAENRMKIIDHVQELAAMRGIGKVTIRLQPDELGSITVTVRSLGTAVQAEVTASNEGVRNALHVQRTDLVQSIESRGLSLNSFTVGHEAGGEAQANDQGNAHHDMRQEFERASNLWSVRARATEPAMAASAAIVADQAVDFLA
ncbi:MAG: flagellar hook-length control protein FliK [Armatimonadetes bacterium]|nr:flagellar hook-length control protein FliK [Armatimonadota bacterium]